MAKPDAQAEHQGPGKPANGPLPVLVTAQISHLVAGVPGRQCGRNPSRIFNGSHAMISFLEPWGRMQLLRPLV